jgi:hypothetical protein
MPRQLLYHFRKKITCTWQILQAYLLQFGPGGWYFLMYTETIFLLFGHRTILYSSITQDDETAVTSGEMDLEFFVWTILYIVFWLIVWFWCK